MRHLIPFFAAAALALSACQPNRAGDLDPTDVEIVHDEGEGPLVLQVTFDHGGHFSAPVLSARFRDSSVPERPVVLVVAGCALAQWSRDFPADAVLVAVFENSGKISEETLTEACIARDAAKISRAVTRQLDFMRANIKRLEIADAGRVAIFASGDATPAAAVYVSPEIRVKFLQGDPCIVPWPRRWDEATATIVLWGAVPSGRGWNSADAGGPNLKREGGTATGIEAAATPCRAQPRPRLPATYQRIEGPGEITVFGRPPGLQAAARDAMSRLTR